MVTPIALAMMPIIKNYQRRAASVGSYLVSQRINSNRIFTKGFGSRNPVVTNATLQERALNRRVVITLRPLS